MREGNPCTHRLGRPRSARSFVTAQTSIAPASQPIVLVLGAGGNVSQGILKALLLCKPAPRVLAACIDPYAMGLYVAERAFVSPYADDPRFLPWLLRTCSDHHVDGVMSGVEPVLSVLSEQATTIERDSGARAVVSPPPVLRIGEDKLTTSRWLEEQGLPHPATAAAQDEDGVDRLLSEVGFPLIAKPRLGKGSVGVSEVHDADELRPLLGRPDYVVQERLSGEEFTVATFTDADGELRGSACMRRRLAHGTTSLAEVGEFPDVREVAESIAVALRPIGPANIQMRMHEGTPIPFEINVRFSGTTPIRARLGFNDVEAALRHLVLHEPPRDLPEARPGVAVRYWNEAFLDPVRAEVLHESGELDQPAVNTRLEDFGRPAQ